MNVLGISGSPRYGGNTDILISKALEGAKDAGAAIEKVILSELDLSPCAECEDLKDDGSCIVEDDMQPIYRKIREADALILASPVFFGSLSAQTKMMIDRFQCAWRAKYILKKDAFPAKGGKKIGAFISVQAADKKSFFENSKSIIKNFFACINVDYRQELYCHGPDEKGAVLKKQDCLNAAYKLGKEIAEQGVG